MSRVRAVSFDFGQTLATLDETLLREKVARLAPGVALGAEAVAAGTRAGWAVYDRAVRSGEGGHPWKRFMETLLDVAGLSDDATRAAVVDALWDDQPRVNLWRRPIAPMIALCRELRDAGVPIGVLSNSEGRLRELMDEMDLTSTFSAIGDSGRIGVEKPDPRIFGWMAGALGVAPAEVVHVGDVRGADVDGALSAGLAAIWYEGDPTVDLGPRGRVCHGADEVRTALVELGLSLASV